MMAPLSALCERSDYKLVPDLNSRSHNGEIVQLQSALNDDYNNFQEKSNTYHISEPILGRFFPDLVLVRSLRSRFIDSFSSAKKPVEGDRRGNKCHLMAKSFLREKTEPTIFGIWPVGYSDTNPRGLDHLK